MSNMVITSSDIQVRYEKLYKFLMEYLWEFSVVQEIADLELAIFKRFPDKEEMKRCLNKLKLSISQTYKELSEDDQTDFEEAVTRLEDAIENFEDPGCELYCVEEVIDDPKDVAAASDIEVPEEKRKFKFGEIRHITEEEKALQEEAANTLSNPFANNEEE